MRRDSGPKKAPGKAKSKPRAAAGKARPLAATAPRHLEERLAEALAQQAAMGEILRVIRSSPTDAQPVFDLIAERAVTLCGAEVSVVSRFDGTRLQLAAIHGVTRAGVEAVRQVYPMPLDFETVTARVYRERAVVHVDDVMNDPTYAMKSEASSAGWRVGLGAPMLRDGQVVGVIFVGRSTPGLFSDQRVDLLQTFAEQAMIAIENVRLFQELEARNRELADTLTQQTATAQILRVISSSPTDIQPVLDTIAASAARLCEAERCFVFRFDGQQLHFAAHHGFSPKALASVRSIWPAPPGRGTAAGRAVLDRRIAHIPDVHQDREYAVAAVATAATFRGIIAVPMLREGVPIGVITLLRPKPGPFSPGQIALLETFADQAVIAIENVNLFGELERRNQALTETLEQQTATGEILRAISSSPADIRPVLETVVRAAARFCGAPDVAILRVDRDVLRGAAAVGPFGRELASRSGGIEALELPLTSGSVSGRAVLERRSIHVHDLLAEPEDELPVGRDLQRRFGHHTILATPLLREGTPLGAIVLFRTEMRPFSDRQLDLVKIFADQAVIAIENVRLFQELQARNRDLTETLEQQTATGEILRVISSSPTDVQPVFETIVKNARALCGSDSAGVFMYDGLMARIEALDNANPAQTNALRDAYPSPATTGTATGRALLSGRPAHIPDVREDPAYVLDALRDTVGLRTLLSVPMIRDGVAIGAITVQRWGTPRAFSDTQMALLETFADQAVIAIQNVRLFRELEVRNRDLTETLEQQTATGEILRVISSSPTDVQPVFDAVVKSAARLCESFDSSMCRRDGDRLVLVAHHGPIPIGPVGEFSLPLSRGNAWGRAVLDAATVHVADMQDETAEFPESSANAQRMGFRTILCVPLVRDGVALGTIQLRRTSNHRFTDRQVVLLRTFADQAVIAIENVRLFRELEVRNRDLTETLEQQTATGEILRVISSSPTDVQPVFDTIVGSVVRLCDGLFSALLRYDGELIHLVAQHNFTAEGLEDGAAHLSGPADPRSRLRPVHPRAGDRPHPGHRAGPGVPASRPDPGGRDAQRPRRADAAGG